MNYNRKELGAEKKRLIKIIDQNKGTEIAKQARKRLFDVQIKLLEMKNVK